MVKTYKELIVWQKSYELVLVLYKVTKSFPPDEIYALTSQMRRAVVSIPSNIAEGYCRQRRLEYIQFLRIAYASGGELETQIMIAKDLHYIRKNKFEEINQKLTEIMKMLNVLIRKLSASS